MASRQRWVWGGAPAAGDSVRIERRGDEVWLRAEVGSESEIHVGERSVTLGGMHLRLPAAVDPARARIQRRQGIVEVTAPVR